MSSDPWMILAVGLFGIIVLVLLFWPWKSPGVRTTLSSDGYQKATVLVGETAFTPSTILVQHGQPVRLIFHRDERAPRCTGKVHLLAFGKTARLFAGESVSVEFMPERPGTYEFNCPRQRFRGRLIAK